MRYKMDIMFSLCLLIVFVCLAVLGAIVFVAGERYGFEQASKVVSEHIISPQKGSCEDLINDMRAIYK